jgi:hypothetical protein
MLLIVSVTLVTAGVAAKKVYALRLVRKWFELEGQRPAAFQELNLLRMARSRQKKDRER